MKPNDPRHIVTPDAFTVAPELLGTPLAGPWRRFWAMMVDLLVIAVLAGVGGSVLFAGAAAWFFFRVARGKGGGVIRRGGRFAFRAGGALMAFVFVLVAWDQVTDWWEDEPVAAPVVSAEGVDLGGVAALVTGGRLAQEAVRLQETDDPEEARELAARFARRLDELGADAADAAEALRGVAAEAEGGDEVAAAIGAVADSLSAVAGVEAAEAASSDPDSMTLALAAALEAGDTAAADELRPRVGEALAAERIEELEDDVSGLREDRDELREEVDELESRGLRSLILTVGDELGLEFGWLALYFGAFTWLWRGQTPGKRLLGVRVVRLDGQPLGLWASFERFGGYAASVFTGLFGFAQVLWDRNRQALHDKVVETVVVREGAPRIRPAEGFAPYRRWAPEPARSPARPDS